jgi:3-hydroxybutyryl-CoA dehydratase
MYKVGDCAELSRVITEEDVFLFAGITGDRNPLHISSDFAQKTRFGERIAHGLLTAGLVSAALGMKLPGPGALLLAQTLRFLAPVRIGDQITARIQIEEIGAGGLRCTTRCFNQNSELVLDGEAMVEPFSGNGKTDGQTD